MLHDEFGEASLDRLQILALIYLGFVDFLSWDDLSGLLHYDTIFYRHHMVIILERNDQFRFCVAALLFGEEILSRGVHFSNSYLLPEVCHTSSGNRLRDKSLHNYVLFSWLESC